MSSIQNSTSCTDLPGDFTTDACVRETGKVIAVAFLHKSATLTDPEDGSEWTTLNTAGDAKLICEVKGDYPGGEPNIGAGVGETDEIILGIKHTINYMHFNVHEEQATVRVNYDFYDKLIKAAGQYRIAVVFGDKNAIISANPVTVDAKHVVEDTLDTLQRWEVVVTCTEEGLFTSFTAPAVLYGQ